jgi:adenine-specific DNA methylase
MSKKRKTFDDIPDMVEQCLDIQQKELDRLLKLSELKPIDVKNTINLMTSLNSIYLTYRLMKKEMTRELQSYSQDKINALRDQLVQKN